MYTIEEVREKAKEKFGIVTFNPMQEEAFRVIPEGKDTMLLSMTGSGKTMGFLIPIMSRLDDNVEAIQCLIIAPTRELALQITQVARDMALGLNIEICYGGHPIRYEKKALENNPQLIVGTPGRILDHLEKGNLKLDKTKYLILDEFDKTLELGFHTQIESIIDFFREKPQRILTSATDALHIPNFMNLINYHKIDYLQDKKHPGLSRHLVRSPNKDKMETLYYLLQDVGVDTTFVFCNYRESVERVSEYLSEKGLVNDLLHGGLNQLERENVLSKFRNGSTRLLITTDLAGRGLDIPDVDHVIHYHHPITEEVYIHRNGRTARMEATGHAYLLLHGDEDIPGFIKEIPQELFLSQEERDIPNPEWVTVRINKGKKDKINKVDVVGFLSKTGNLGRSELGLVELKDRYALAAVKKEKANQVLQLSRNKKIKGKNATVEIL